MNEWNALKALLFGLHREKRYINICIQYNHCHYRWIQSQRQSKGYSTTGRGTWTPTGAGCCCCCCWFNIEAEYNWICTIDSSNLQNHFSLPTRSLCWHCTLADNCIVHAVKCWIHNFPDKLLHACQPSSVSLLFPFCSFNSSRSRQVNLISYDQLILCHKLVWFFNIAFLSTCVLLSFKLILWVDGNGQFSLCLFFCFHQVIMDNLVKTW